MSSKEWEPPTPKWKYCKECAEITLHVFFHITGWRCMNCKGGELL